MSSEILGDTRVALLGKDGRVLDAGIPPRLHVPDDRLSLGVGTLLTIVPAVDVETVVAEGGYGLSPPSKWSFRRDVRTVGGRVRGRGVGWTPVDVSPRTGDWSPAQLPDGLRVGRGWSIGSGQERIPRRSLRGRWGGGRTSGADRRISGVLTAPVRKRDADGTIAIGKGGRQLPGPLRGSPTPISAAILRPRAGRFFAGAARRAHGREGRVVVRIVAIFFHLISPQLLGVLLLLAPPPEKQQGDADQRDGHQRHDDRDGNLPATLQPTASVCGRGRISQRCRVGCG